MSKSEKCTKINKDNDTKRVKMELLNQPKKLKGVVALWIKAYTIQKQFSRCYRK